MGLCLSYNSLLIKRLPTTSLNFAIPYCVPFNKDPDVSFLEVFGCTCFPLLKPYHSHKLVFRYEECIFLGYSQIHKGYKCLSSSGKVYISKDVRFNEDEFPYTCILPILLILSQIWINIIIYISILHPLFHLLLCHLLGGC